jgi:SAM-dependent methyltransferase
MKVSNRWKKAQAYEQGYWQATAQKIAEGSDNQITFYEWRAGQIRKYLASLGEEKVLDGSHRILEMGSGPLGVVGYLPGVERVAVDPLNKYYASNENLTRLRNKDVQYITAPGEAVPLESGTFDLVIIENCIDHVQDMDAVMKEISRLMVPHGLLYLTVNSRSRFGYYVHRILAKLALDPGHPHTFTKDRLISMLDQKGYDLLMLESGSWGKAWLEDLKKPSRKTRMKALLMVSEFLLTSVSRKK